MFGFTATTAALLAISVLCAVAYGVAGLRAEQSALRSLLKTGAVGALAALALADGAPWLLVAALGLSALGDLALSRDGERAFMIGLGAFLLAHVAYVPLLLSVAGDVTFLRIAAMIGAAVYAAAVARWLWPHLGPMRAPVAVYILAIVAMGASAMTAPPGLWPIMLGAALFIASDTALAAETFVFRQRVRRWTAPFIWTTYYAGQALIASAWLCRSFAAG